MRSDAELLKAYAKAGDDAAFAELVARHGAMVYRACLRALGNGHDAEEAAQATFVVLVRKAGRLSGGGDLAGWLHSVARNVALRSRRGRLRRSRSEEDAAMQRSAEAAVPAPGQSAPELGEDLDRELAALSAGQRQAVVLRYLEGRSEREAAEAAGVPVGTLSRRASDGLERLRQRLCQRGRVLGSAALVGLLGSEATAAVPATLLPSILAVSKAAAAGAAAGTVGAGAMTLAEGAMKAMFWIKVKLAAAVLMGAAAVGTGGTVAVMAAAEPAKPEPPKVEAAATEKGIECRVTAVLAGGKVTLSAGSAQGVKERFEFDVSREGKKLGEVKTVAVGERESTAEIVSTTGEIRVGDAARTRFAAVAAQTGGGPPPTGHPAQPVVRIRLARPATEKPAQEPEPWVVDAVRRLPVEPRVGERPPAHVEAATDWATMSWTGSTKLDAGYHKVDAGLKRQGEQLVLNLGMQAGDAQGMASVELDAAPGTRKAQKIAGDLYLVAEVIAGGVIAWGQAAGGLQAGLVPLGGQPGVAVVIVSGLVKHINAGKPVARSLAEIAGDNPGRVAEVAKLMEKVIRDGKLLAEAMAAHPETFDAATVEAIRRSEDDRTLDLALETLSGTLAAANRGGMAFVEGELIGLELHLRNTTEGMLSAFDAGYLRHWILTFTPRAGGGKLTAYYAAKDSPRAGYSDVVLNAQQEGLACKIWLEPNRSWRFGEAGRLPPGRYLVAAEYAHPSLHMSSCRKAPCPYWHGKVSTGAVDIEVRATGEPPAGQKPDAF